MEGSKVTEESLELDPPGPYLIQVGKRRFFRVRFAAGSGAEGG